tara:strand:- start:4013 stop:4465 length:453 start_codon:yes stop_codon:yes gene_type:complete
VNKRGLSPVIATVLLISIAIVLALIIFLWARGFISESVRKFDEPVERACDLVAFEAEADTTHVYVVNKGNVVLYGMEVKKKSRGGAVQGDSGYDPESREVLSGIGETSKFALNSDSNDELLLIPVILGETNTGKVMHVCDTKYGLPITVI